MLVTMARGSDGRPGAPFGSWALFHSVSPMTVKTVPQQSKFWLVHCIHSSLGGKESVLTEAAALLRHSQDSAAVQGLQSIETKLRLLPEQSWLARLTFLMCREDRRCL